jgi:hypothetical protein
MQQDYTERCAGRGDLAGSDLDHMEADPQLDSLILAAYDVKVVSSSAVTIDILDVNIASKHVEQKMTLHISFIKPDFSVH